MKKECNRILRLGPLVGLGISLDVIAFFSLCSFLPYFLGRVVNAAYVDRGSSQFLDCN